MAKTSAKQRKQRACMRAGLKGIKHKSRKAAQNAFSARARWCKKHR